MDVLRSTSNDRVESLFCSMLGHPSLVQKFGREHERASTPGGSVRVHSRFGHKLHEPNGAVGRYESIVSA